MHAQRTLVKCRVYIHIGCCVLLAPTTYTAPTPPSHLCMLCRDARELVEAAAAERRAELMREADEYVQPPRADA